MSEQKVVWLIATDGSEEMELTICYDIFKRAGLSTRLLSLHDETQIRCSRGLAIKCDAPLREDDELPDLIVLPGGLPGAEAFADSLPLGKLLRAQAQRGGFIAAICAAPLALKAHKIFLGKRLSCHPSVGALLSEHYEVQGTRLCLDGNLLSSQGPGTSFEFALTIVELLSGPEKADEVRAPLVLYPGQ